MKTSWWVRFSVLLILIATSVIVLLPTVLKFDETGHYPVKSKINLGLDLQGGLYMVLGIDFKKVYRDEVQTYARKIEAVLKDQDIAIQMGSLDTSDVNDPKQSFMLVDASKKEEAKNKIKSFFGNNVRITKEEGAMIQIGVASAVKSDMETQAVGKSIEVIRNRIDEFGVTEPEIIAQGNDRIVVQLPGVKDIERAKELIGKTAKLEFKIVNDEIPAATIQTWLDKAATAGIVYKKGERFSDYIAKLNEFLAQDIPHGYELAFEKTDKEDQNIPYVIENVARISGDDLADARVQIDQQQNSPYVSMEFKPAGAKKFEETTGASIGKRMAVVLDGNVYSAPVIQAKIAGGNAQITLGSGDFNRKMKEARDLALVLRAGALPVQLDFLEQRSVGPSLGTDSIQMAETASVWACLVMFAFIIIYYRTSGVITTATLVINVLFTMSALVLLGATLTLPGIAGIALTVGMAVDGNIIIMEKIREDLRSGLSIKKAVENGYESAFWTLVDANVTTAAAGICLLNFGTGPVRGFAVTLLIGIAVTLYTSYGVSKIFTEFYLEKTNGNHISI